MSNIRFEDYAGKLRVHEQIKPPVIVHKWYAHKNGAAHETSTRQETEAISMNVEKVVTKESQIAFEAPVGINPIVPR